MQLRRSATAIASRIAEGCGREGNVDFMVDLRKAVASCNEVEYLLLLAKDLEYMKHEVYEQLTAETIEIRKMLRGLLRKL
jgi:four helix bundle protein